MTTAKNVAKTAILAMAAWLVVIWVAGWYIDGDMNPMDWPTFGRLLHLIVASFLTLMVTVVRHADEFPAPSHPMTF